MPSALPKVTNVGALVGFIWNQYEFMIKTENITVLNIPGEVVDIIGESGINTIARSFSEFIGAPVKRAFNPGNGTHRIVPANYHLGHHYIIKGGTEPKRPVAKKDKPPRPPNAFILYRQRHHPLLRAKFPNLHNNQISIILGKQWQLANEETKAHFKKAADIIKQRHVQAYPNYQYQPRKPFEKKRRMTRRRDDSTKSTGVDLNVETSNIDRGVPDFGTTAAGTPFFDLGDEHYDDATFAAMLGTFNATLGQNPNRHAGLGPVLFSEPTEEAQDDYNLFNAFLHFDKFVEKA